MAKQATCEERVGDSLRTTIDDLRLMRSADRLGLEGGEEFDQSEAFPERMCDICGEITDCIDFQGYDQNICKDCLEKLEDLGPFHEYGLCFDYVAAGTFTDQEQGYFRYQLSYGGPSDEFRFYTDPGYNCYRVEYWFLDLYDGASRELRDQDKVLLLDIFEYFKDCGTVEHQYEEATS